MGLCKQHSWAAVWLRAAVCCALAVSTSACLAPCVVPSPARASASFGRLPASAKITSTRVHQGGGGASKEAEAMCVQPDAGMSAVDRRTAVLGAGAAAAWFVAGAPRRADAQSESPSWARGRGQKSGDIPPWEGARPKVPVWELEGGVAMPTLALNVVDLSSEDTAKAVRLAVVNGITHIDFHPGKERDGVAVVLASGEMKREVRPRMQWCNGAPDARRHFLYIPAHML